MIVNGSLFREIESNSWDVEARLAECDAAGVDVQVLSTVPVMFSYWAEPDHALDLARRLNDHIAGVVAAHPTRFAGLGTIPMQSPDLAIRELERCVRELGLRGSRSARTSTERISTARSSFRSSRRPRRSAPPFSSTRGRWPAEIG